MFRDVWAARGSLGGEVMKQSSGLLPAKMSFAEISSRLSPLYSAVLCDVLDSLGFRHQAVSHQIRPLFPDARVIGRARTMLSKTVNHMPEKPYAMEMEALDTLKRERRSRAYDGRGHVGSRLG